MKTIFLDVDGVLNSINFPEYAIDEHRVKLLAKLVEETGAVVVIHSGWRFWFDDCMQPQTDEAKHLFNLLRKYKVTLYGKTPDLTTEKIRANKTFSLVKAQEILSWLNEHTPVESYVVLDDLDLGNHEVQEHQVRTDSSYGLSDIDVQNAIQKLSDLE